MVSRKTKLLLMKIFGMFSIVRGYNIPIIALAQYLAAVFILSPNSMPALTVILDGKLLLLVLASSIAIASGYIINNFYDSEKDLINRPRKSMLDRLVSRKTQLTVYFSLNFLVVILGFLVSWRVALFYSGYIFLIWFYSHKLKKYPIIGNVTAAVLAVLPFFGILIYYAKLDDFKYLRDIEYGIIFWHAAFLMMLLLIRELVKDLENLPGDFANQYKTVPVVYGERLAKIMISSLAALTVLPVYMLVEQYNVGYMDLYFYVCLMVLLIMVPAIWKAAHKKQFVRLHFALKLLIVTGVFSIVLIDPSVLVHGRQRIEAIVEG
jgi:4-hydroxybenzoate polyprenyltransferase